jgi:hypothetical protein
MKVKYDIKFSIPEDQTIREGSSKRDWHITGSLEISEEVQTQLGSVCDQFWHDKDALFKKLAQELAWATPVTPGWSKKED